MSAPGPLQGVKVLSLALNLPGPAAAQRLRRLGAEVLKVEPPSGDPMATYSRAWYLELHEGITRRVLDLKEPQDRATFQRLLEDSDLFLASSRPSALRRLGLDPELLEATHRRLCQVLITGYPAPRENEAGHDLTYQASLGLIDPPHLPRSLVSDLAGAERAVSAALALLYQRERTDRGGLATVSLAEAAEPLGEPLRHGLTAPGALLGGGVPEYALYATADGWIALAALEPHFKARVAQLLGTGSAEGLRAAFAQHPSAHWQAWGQTHDVPLETVRS